MSVTQFLHASLLITDLSTARHFYETLLGLAPAERNLSFPGLWYQVGPVQIHLIAADQMMGDRVNDQKWGRNRHLAFAVMDLEAIRRRLEDAGYPIQLSSSGRPALFVADPDGNLIELAQS
ncbi:MAG: VOC family protein [Thermosynechococcaceae cyanobacterium]